MRTQLRTTLTALAAGALLAGSAGTALAAEPAEGWVGGPGVSVSEDGVVTLDSTAGPTSYEHQNLEVAVANGDTITFEYQGPCGGGAPRVFIQGGAYNTFDADPNGVTAEPACGADDDGDGWFTVSTTVAGITDGVAGHTGIVNDAGDGRTVSVRELTIAGTEVALVATEDDEEVEPDKPKKANHGQCVRAAAKDGKSRSEAAKSDCGKKAKKAKKAKSNKGKAHGKTKVKAAKAKAHGKKA